MAFGSIGLDITGNTSGLAKDVEKDIGGAFKRVAGIASAAFAAIQISGMFKGFIDGARESARIGRLTENVIKSTGQAAGVTAKQVGDLATAISNKTGADDEAIQSGSNMLLTFTRVRDVVGKNNDIFTQATKAVVDMSAGLNSGDVSAESIRSTSLQLGKALNDPVQGMLALTRSGVSFTEQQKAQVKKMVESNHMLDAQKLILKELSTEFGGAAAAASDSSTKLKTIFDNLGENIGTLLLPTLDRVAVALTDRVIPAVQGWIDGLSNGTGPLSAIETAARGVGDYLQNVFGDAVLRLKDRFIEAGPGLKDLMSALTEFGVNILPTLTRAIKYAAEVVGILVLGLGQVGTFLNDHVVVFGTLATIIGTYATGVAIAAAASAIWTAVTGGLVTAFWALNAAMAANPIGIVVLAIAALTAGFVYAWKNSETFRTVVAGVFNFLVTFIADSVKAWFNLIVGFWEGVLNLLGKIPFADKVIPGLKAATDAVHNFRVSVNNEIDSIKTRVQISVTADTSQAMNALAALQRAQQAATGKLIGPIIPGTKRPTVAGGGFGASTAMVAKLKSSGTASGGGGASAPQSGGASDAKAKKAAADAAKKAAAAAKAAAAKVRATADKAVGSQITARTFVDSITGGQEAIKTAFDKLIGNLKAGNKPALAAYAADVQKQLLNIAVKRDAVSEQLTLAKDKLAELHKESDSYAMSVKKAITDTGNIATHNVITFTGIRNSLRAAVKQATEFRAAIANLTAAGLNKSSLQDLITAGPEAGLAAAKSLMQGGAKGIKEVNDLTAQLGSVGQAMGSETANTFYQAGIQAAAGLVAGLQSQEAALNAQMDRMATQMANTLKKQLKIKSPSQVFAGIGRYIGSGLEQGINASRGRVAAASGRLGSTVVNNFGGVSVSGLGDPVHMERGGIMAGRAIANTLQRTQAAMTLAGTG